MKRYYLQMRGFVGNCMRWWKRDDIGFTCDIRRARIFNRYDADYLCKNNDGLTMWPESYIDERVTHHIKFEDCNHNNATKGDK